MADLGTGQENVLRGWFERQIKGCGKDPSVYDFAAEIDRSLTYHENKAKLENVVTAICGARPPTKKELAQMARCAEEKTHACCYCGKGFHYSKKLEATALQQLKSHEAYERSKGKAPLRRYSVEETTHVEEVPVEEFM